MTNSLTSTQRKDYAKSIYLRESISQQEIAERVGVSRQTVSRWMGEWKQLKLSLRQTREERINSTLQQLANLDNAIEKRAQGERFPTSKEADIKRKLTADLDTLEKEASVRDIFNVSRNFLEWLRKRDLDKAKELSGLFDHYIKEMMQWVK